MKRKMLFGLALSCMLPLALTGAAPAADQALPVRYSGDSEVSAARLQDLVEPLFEDGAAAPTGQTRAVLVLHDGKVIAERYAPGFGPDSRMLSWSIAKTVTAVLVGIMVSDGRLALDDPVPVPAWRQRGDPRGEITLRQMLNMASGIAHKEKEGPLEQTDALRMLVGDGAADMARYAQSRPLAREPGSSFHYDSATTLVLCDMMTRLLTDSDQPRDRRDAMMRFVEQRLIDQVGLHSLVPEFDARGTMIGGALMHMTARDYARLGELLRNHGRVGGRQIIPDRWVRFMTSSSPHNEGYGAHIWLNRPGGEPALFPGRARPSVFGASGLQGQYVIVSPRQRLTVVRLGVTSDAKMPALRDALARIVEGMPGG
jgi:CubicO group peptidase (beta-lactamase class C family)